ncbi:MAG: J domain-containing protein [Spirochaetales bacterium]|nr:J domain-containing protein [Spirochaetales bacterium]
MIVVWGKLVGLGLGVFGGPFGAVFGLFVGHLLDVVAAEFLLRRSLARFLMGPQVRASPQFDPAAAVAALAVASVVDTAWRPSPDDKSAFKLAVDERIYGPETRHSVRRFAWPAALRWMRIGHGQPGQYLDAALHLRPNIDLKFFASRMTAEIAADDRARVIEICRSTLDSEARGPVLERLRRLAQLIGLPDDWIRGALPTPVGSTGITPIDTEACAILGIEPDASLAEVRRAYRRLAAQFHPDTAMGLSPEQQEASSAAFVRIRSAYERVASQLTEGR